MKISLITVPMHRRDMPLDPLPSLAATTEYTKKVEFVVATLVVRAREASLAERFPMERISGSRIDSTGCGVINRATCVAGHACVACVSILASNCA